MAVGCPTSAAQQPSEEGTPAQASVQGPPARPAQMPVLALRSLGQEPEEALQGPADWGPDCGLRRVKLAALCVLCPVPLRSAPRWQYFAV